MQVNEYVCAPQKGELDVCQTPREYNVPSYPNSVCVFSWDKTKNPEPWNNLDPTYQYKVIQHIHKYSVTVN